LVIYYRTPVKHRTGHLLLCCVSGNEILSNLSEAGSSKTGIAHIAQRIVDLSVP
jgi:hypothetical protein